MGGTPHGGILPEMGDYYIVLRMLLDPPGAGLIFNWAGLNHSSSVGVFPGIGVIS